jgi:hypothetical protein
MKTAEELESMARHPSAIADGSGAADDVTAPRSAYGAFFEALSTLSECLELYGAGSSEVAVARRRVDRMREAAIASWRQERQLAA